MAIASITKLMTALVTLEHARPGEIVTVPPRRSRRGGSSIVLTAGERLRVRELLAAALIQSANDAAFALAADVGDGSVKRFVGMMNAKAAELGPRRDALRAPGRARRAPDTSRPRGTRSSSRAARDARAARPRARPEADGEVPPDRMLESWNDLLCDVPGADRRQDRPHRRRRLGRGRRRPARADDGLRGPAREPDARTAGTPTSTDAPRVGLRPVRDASARPQGRAVRDRAVPFAEDEQLELVAAAGASELVRLGDGPVRRARGRADDGRAPGHARDRSSARSSSRTAMRRWRGSTWWRRGTSPSPSCEERVGWYADRALDEAGDILASAIPGL